jgi:hypothetical protein
MFSKILLSAAAIACTVFCLHQNAQQNARTARAKAELSAIASQHLPMEKETTLARERLATAEQEITALRQSIALLERIEFIDATVPEKPEEAAKTETDSIAKQEQKARGYRSQLVSQYAPFYYRVGLSNTQIDRLEVMLTDHWQSVADIKAITETKKLEDDDPSALELRAKADQTLHNAEKELLGAESFQRLQDYERTLPAREFTASVAENLYFTEIPLNAAQAEKLTHLLTDNNEPFRKGKTFAMDETEWVKVREQIKTILSPKQYGGFLSTYNVHAVMPQCYESFAKKINSLDELFDTSSSKKE